MKMKVSLSRIGGWNMTGIKLKKYHKSDLTIAQPCELSLDDALTETIELYGGTISRIPQSIFDRVEVVRAKALLNEGDKGFDYSVAGKTKEEKLINLRKLFKQQKETNVNSS
jgi:hypothetical protein